MTHRKNTKSMALIAGAAFTLLTACGGGGGGSAGGGDIVPTLDPPSNPFDISDGAVVAKVLTPSAGSVETVSGNVTDGAFAVGDLAGQLNGSSTIASLTNGGGVTLAASGTEFVGLFDASPQGNARAVGVIGLATPTADLPSGSLQYTGASNVTIIDGTDLYDLSGDVTIDAVLTGGSPSITTTIDALDGTRTDTVSAPVDVSDVGALSITGSTLDGASFSGGSVSLTSESITALGSDATVSLEGGVYGPNGEEIGGVGVIDDSVDVTFDFIGRR